MNQTRLTQALLVAVVGAAALAGCRKDDQTHKTATDTKPATPATAPATTPAATTPATSPAPPPTGTATAGTATVTLGSAIGANNVIATPRTTFSAGDTIHASVATDASMPVRLTAKWTHLGSNQTVAEETKDVAAGAHTTDFHISKPDGWPTGRYRVEISEDGKLVNTSEFTVQ